MKTYIKLSMVAFAAFIYFATFALAQNQQSVPYPEGYRLWTHVKSGIVPPDKPAGGLHNIYANPEALKGFKTGEFADGSVIVFDLLTINSANGTPSLGDRRLLDVMHKDSKKFATTGGWGIEEFRGDSRTQRDVGENSVAKCFTCHAGQKDRGFVFSSAKELQ